MLLLKCIAILKKFHYVYHSEVISWLELNEPYWVILTDLTIVRFNFHVGKAATKKQKYEKISEKKMSTPVEVLCKVIFLIAFATLN
jgi:hypothetical protein